MADTGARNVTTGDKPTTFSSTGCWTCKIRRKKCEGTPPICNACSALQVPCHFQSTRPEWMDAGLKQEEMARTLKTQIRENSHLRRVERSVGAGFNSNTSTTTNRGVGGAWSVFSQVPTSKNSPIITLPSDFTDTPLDAEPMPTRLSSPRPVSHQSDCALVGAAALESKVIGRAESNLMMFYLESLFPFLFPFYRPCVLQGGRAWILELMIKSPVVRQAMLCQSSYYLSLAEGTTDSDAAFEIVLAQTSDVFHLLRQTLSPIHSEGIAVHIHGAVRTLSSIIQLQRFEIALSSFGNCQAHLSACVSLFQQLLDVGLASNSSNLSCPSSSYHEVLYQLGPSSWTLSGKTMQLSSSEQDAFRFSSALLIFDDIIASTVLQETPRLYELHTSLLATEAPVIDLGAVIGCENWVIIQIGKIAALDAWKQQRRRAGTLDIVELVQRAMMIKRSIEENSWQMHVSQTASRSDANALLNTLWATSSVASLSASSSLTVRIWAHAAMLYLSVVVSGWQPANNEVRMHVQQSLDLMPQLTPNNLLRVVCWPLCVVGCLAEPGQEESFRKLVRDLQPQSIFGPLYSALMVMENVWRHRSTLSAEHDFAACFRCQDDLILLV